ncbi:MAG: FkbM family methyltransferase [Chitinophagaceae bacterium]|nr:FkbM family methyltransferase [Chitinophagaceae bacterium]
MSIVNSPFFYNLVLRNYSPLKRMGMFERLWRQVASTRFDVPTMLYGATATLPSDFSLPVTAREFPSFNNPFLELVHYCHRRVDRKLVIIDVGASIGDGFLFINQNLPSAVEKYICIEGHPRFFDYLKQNTATYNNVLPLQAVLSDRREQISSLVGIHESTASAQGDKRIEAVPLDELLDSEGSAFDIIKIDTDGFDGRVLNGSRNILNRSQPYLIFEYHPLLISQTKNNLLQPFDVLEQCGYSRLLWYDKFGKFSHESKASDIELHKKYADDCLRQSTGADPHFDIIALPPADEGDTDELANCTFSSKKIFQY